MDPLIEIRRETQASDGFWTTWKNVFSPKGKGEPKFYGPDTVLKLDRGHVTAPLVYLVKGTVPGAPDASLIETGLPVSRKRTAKVDDLPYWPSYRGASPQQRALYIDWLVGGRQEKQVPLGYVFIYFYGLERRVIADNADHGAVAAEILRLLPIYGHSRSFVRYATRLLWTTIWLGLNAGTASSTELKPAIIQTTDWREEVRGLSLACFYRLGFRLSAKMAYLLIQHDPQAPRSVVVKRQADLHKRAFCKQFDEVYPDGFELHASKRSRNLEYFPASATLGRGDRDPVVNSSSRIPDILGIPTQFRPLIQFWLDATDELKQYDRLHQKTGGSDETAEMFEALPDELRQGDHPHLQAWYEILNHSVTEDGWTVVPVSALARIEGYPERKKLTKCDSVQLTTRAFHMGLAIEPDPQITGRAYLWDELVSIFPIGDDMPDQAVSYQAASVLLELGVVIAAADGVIDEVELRRITSHLETQFALSRQDSVRLEHLRYLRTKSPPHDFDAARALRKKLTVEQRRLIGQFLVGIAAADEHISPDEIASLRSAYKALGLSISDLESVLGSSESEPATSSGPDLAVKELRLDMTRINAIMADTARVKEFLVNVLADESEEDTPAGDDELVSAATRPATPPVIAIQAVSPDSRFGGLSNRFLRFASVAIEQDEWQRHGLDAVAREQSLMLGAAIEAINDWAYDKLGDALLVDDGDRVLVQRNLVKPKVPES